jgi:DNA helicase-2/ATP-dependent DNA helicase PcrA
MNYLESLNDKQKEAVLHTEGPLLVLAGAGAGKTKMVTCRILHLIKNGVAPHNILAITFTNKASKEMRDRVMNLIHSDKELNIPISFNEKPFVSTFHSLGVHILREHSQKLGLKRMFSIFDKSDAKRAVKEAIVSSGLDPKLYDAGKFLSMISREKGNMKTVSMLEGESTNDYTRTMLFEVWNKYENTLKKEHALDFDDLLLKTAMLLRDYKEVREYYQNLWKYIHVDEYQDTNTVQYEITTMLSAGHRNLCVVGDIDQNIYSWRGADIKNILNFERDYKEAKVVLLEQNYRSTQTILSAANQVIEKNEKRRKKVLFTENPNGEKIKVVCAYDENDEARQIGEKIETLMNKGSEPRDICILYRANFQSRVLEESMLHRAIPYQVLGTKFFERKEVKDVLSYMRLALNPESLADLKRVINEPVRGIGKVTVLKILEGKRNELPLSTRNKVDDFFNLIGEIKEMLERDRPSAVVSFILRASGMEESFMKDGLEGEERLENVKELVTLATKYDALPQGEGIEKMLEEAALASDQDEIKEDKNAVKLMTIHASKGLEFDHVFISGLEQGLFPHERMGEKNHDTEEERRLFYVALTRARKCLYLSCAGMRTIFGNRQVNMPSEFLSDIDEQHIEREVRNTSASAKDIFIDF